MALKSLETVLTMDGGPFSDAMTQAIVKQKEMADIVRKASSTYMETRTAAEQYAIKVHELKQQLGFGHISQETFNRAVTKAETAFHDANREMGKGNAVMGQFSGLLPGPIADLGRLGLAAGAAAIAIQGIRFAASVIPEALAQFDALGDAAEQAGVSIRELQQLKFLGSLSGLDVDNLTGAVAKMQAAIGRAAVEGGRTAETLNRLGVNAKQLMGLPFAQQMEMLAAAFAKLQTAEERALFLRTLKLGKEMGPVLDKMRDGLEAAAKDGEAFFQVLSDIDNQKLDQASDAVGRLGRLWEGYKTNVALAASETITATADMLESLARVNKEMGGKASNIEGLLFGWVPEGWSETVDKMREDIAKQIVERKQLEADAREAKEKGIDPTRDAADSAVSDKARKTLEDTIEKLREEAATFGMSAAQKKAWEAAQLGVNGAIDEETKALADEAKALADSIDAMQAKAKADQEAEQNAKRLQDTLDKLKFDADTAGLTDMQKKIKELAQAGADGFQLGQALKDMQTIDKAKKASEETKKKEQDAKKAAEDQKRDAEKFREGALTPAQKSAENMAKIDELEKAGLMKAADAAAARLKEQKDFAEKAAKGGALPLAGKAMQRGSADAISFMNRQKAEGFRMTEAKQQLDNAKKQLDEQKKANQALEDIKKKLPNFGRPPIANF